MERKEFLRSIGAAAAFALIMPCASCSGGDDSEMTLPEENGGDGEPDGNSNVDFTVDLSSQAAEPLQTPGGYIIINETVVAKNLDGNFVAATRRCPHEGNYQIVYEQDGTTEVFSCDVHGSRFNLSGDPVNSITANKLFIFNTEVNGDMLRVYE